MASAHPRDIFDLEADASPTVPVVGDDAACHMQGMIALAEQHFAQIAPERAEGDRLEAASIRCNERTADMIAASTIGKEDAMRGQREERVGIAGAIGSRLLEKLDQVEVHGPGRQRAIEFERAPRRKLDRMRQAPRKERPELADARYLDRETRRHRVAAALDEEARLERLPHSAAQIHSGDRAAGTGRAQR